MTSVTHGNSTKCGPVRLGKMELVHPPGHIFWKKEPTVDKLSLYLDKMVSEKGEESTETDPSFDDKVLRVVERLYSKLFSEDLMFVNLFELPPQDLFSAEQGIHLQRVSEKEYDCRLFLRRFTDQTAFQMQFGVQSDIPPGKALYRTHPNVPREMRAFLEKEWAPVLDSEGYLSPAKMYPWFAMGIANAVTVIRDEDTEKTEEVVNGNEEKEPKLKDDSDFKDIEVAGDFPVVRLLFPPNGADDRNSDDVTLSIANSSRSQEDFNEAVPEGEGHEPGNRKYETPPRQSQSARASVQQSAPPSGALSQSARPDTSRLNNSRPQATQEQTGNSRQEVGSVRGSASGRNSKGNLTHAHRPTAAKYHQGGRGDVTYRSSQQENEYGPLTIWSLEEIISCDQDMQEVPLMITIRPCIRGYGLPPTVKLKHGLPTQAKPYSDKGRACVKNMQDQIEDGQSLWFLEAKPIVYSENIQKSARFRGTFRKLGSISRFWSVSMSPIESVIRAHTVQAYTEHEFSIYLQIVKSAVQIVRSAQGWGCVTDGLIDTAIVNVVKHNMLTMRSEGECYVKVLQFLHGVIKSKSCPSFLLPNVNIASNITEQESKWVASDLHNAICQTSRDPGHVLTYIGYGTKQKETNRPNSLLY